jgi:hypothetical protein
VNSNLSRYCNIGNIGCLYHNQVFRLYYRVAYNDVNCTFRPFVGYLSAEIGKRLVAVYNLSD